MSGLTSLHQLHELSTQRDIKDLKLMGLATPAAWAVFHALKELNGELQPRQDQEKEGEIQDSAPFDKDSEIQDEKQEQIIEDISKRWGSICFSDSSDSDTDSEEIISNAKISSNNFRVFPWRHPFVFESSSDEDQ